MRDAVKPGRGGANLLSNSFKFNRDCYYCISREKPDIMWIECIKDKKDINLKFFRARDTTSYPENFQPFMDHGDNVDEFIARFENPQRRKALGDTLPLLQKATGAAFPPPGELLELLNYIHKGKIRTHFNLGMPQTCSPAFLLICNALQRFARR